MCLDKSTDRWTPVPGLSTVDTQSDRIALQFHTLRRASVGNMPALPVSNDPSMGQFWLLAKHPGSSRPFLFASNAVSRTSRPVSVPTQWRPIDVFKNEWNIARENPATGGFVGGALYEDTETSAMRGAQWHIMAPALTVADLSWSPSVTGIFNMQLGTGNDWHVMEAWVCRGIYVCRTGTCTSCAVAPDCAATCGTTNYWGY